MNKQLISPELLAKADKVLFVAPFAIGDFLYWQSYFKAFRAAYPHIKIHVWVDEVRRTLKWWKWPALRRYSLYDWLRACSFVDKVYSETYSPWAQARSLRAAQQEKYPIVAALATIRGHEYASLARKIAPRSFVVGFQLPVKWSPSMLRKWFGYRSLSAKFPIAQAGLQSGYHITDLYAAGMEAFFGLHLPVQARKPFMIIPQDWRVNAQLMLLKWGIIGAGRQISVKPYTVFINIFAKNKKRCWTFDAAMQLIALLRKQERFIDAYFIFNTMPSSQSGMEKMLGQQDFGKVLFFSAHEHFFQLPAIIELCDLVISVETAVMHIAAALKVPVVALMRSKNPEWVPWDHSYSHILMAAGKNDWVRDIPPAQVLQAVNEFVLQRQEAPLPL